MLITNTAMIGQHNEKYENVSDVVNLALGV